MTERENRHSRALAVMQILPFPLLCAGEGWARVYWDTDSLNLNLKPVFSRRSFSVIQSKTRSRGFWDFSLNFYEFSLLQNTHRALRPL